MILDQFWLPDAQFSKIAPHLPADTRGKARVDDRRVISGIIHVLKSGGRWIDAPPDYGPKKTLYNRYVRWAAKGVWVDLFHALAQADGPAVQVLGALGRPRLHVQTDDREAGLRLMRPDRPQAQPGPGRRPERLRRFHRFQRSLFLIEEADREEGVIVLEAFGAAIGFQLVAELRIDRHGRAEGDRAAAVQIDLQAARAARAVVADLDVDVVRKARAAAPGPVVGPLVEVQVGGRVEGGVEDFRRPGGSPCARRLPRDRYNEYGQQNVNHA